MASQAERINPTATNGRSDVEHVHKNLDRLTNIARANVRVARATANIAHAGEYRWRLPAGSALPKEDSSFETGFDPRRRIDSDGSRSGLLSRSGRNTSMIDARAESRHAHGGQWAMRAGAGSDRFWICRARSKRYQELNARVQGERFQMGGNTRRRRCVGMPSRRVERARARVLKDGGELSACLSLPANVQFAPVIRGVNPPANIARREFARPTSGGRVSNDGGGRASITVNSTPTVVINGQAGAATQHDLIGALRAHREELFDQLKRESARRERAQF